MRRCATLQWRPHDPSFSHFVTIHEGNKRQTTYYDNTRTVQCYCNVRLKWYLKHYRNQQQLPVWCRCEEVAGERFSVFGNRMHIVHSTLLLSLNFCQKYADHIIMMRLMSICFWPLVWSKKRRWERKRGRKSGDRWEGSYSECKF